MKARSNTSRVAILGMLSLGPQSGYGIKKLVEGSIAHFWSESFGQIYPILRTLEADGLAVRRSERQDGKPDRRVYSITAEGLAELHRWLVRPSLPEGFRSELLLKLFLGRRVPTEESIRQVEHFKARQTQLLRTYADVEQRLRRDKAHDPDLPFWLMTLHYGHARAAALVHWSDDTLRSLARLGRRRSRAKAPAAQRRTR